MYGYLAYLHIPGRDGVIQSKKETTNKRLVGLFTLLTLIKFFYLISPAY